MANSDLKQTYSQRSINWTIFYKFSKSNSVTLWTNSVYKNINIFDSNRTVPYSHSILAVRAYLQNIFNKKLIQGHSNLFWLVRSSDLSLLNYFLWNCFKQQIYKREPYQDVDYLERIIVEPK